MFDKATAEKIIDLLMPLVDTEFGVGCIEKGLGFTVTPEFLEALMQADTFCSAYVLSRIVPPEQAKAVYDQNMKQSIEAAEDELDNTYGPLTPANIFLDNMRERIKERYPDLNWDDEENP